MVHEQKFKGDPAIVHKFSLDNSFKGVTKSFSYSTFTCTVDRGISARQGAKNRVNCNDPQQLQLNGQMNEHK
jgi:hypothetical protein